MMATHQCHRITTSDELTGAGPCHPRGAPQTVLLGSGSDSFSFSIEKPGFFSCQCLAFKVPEIGQLEASSEDSQKLDQFDLMVMQTSLPLLSLFYHLCRNTQSYTEQEK